MARLPAAPGAYGQPPVPPLDASKAADPQLEGGRHVRQRGSPRVVKVHRQPLRRDPGVQQGAHDPAHIRGPCHPDGVADAHLLDAELHQLLRDADHRRLGDFALVRAAECGRDVGARPEPPFTDPGHHGGEGGHRVRDRHADVVLHEGLGRGGEEADGVRPRVERACHAALVGDQHRVADTGPALECAHQLVGISELRDRLRRYEGGRLDLSQAGIGQEGDEVELRLGRDRPLLVLQAVSRADLVDPHLSLWHGRIMAGRFRHPPSPIPPPARRLAAPALRPARQAVSPSRSTAPRRRAPSSLPR